MQLPHMMNERIVDTEIVLIPYYPNPDEALPWYQDYDVVKMVDNRDELYDLDLLNAMYTYLSTNGYCYYIRYNGKLVGDVSLRNDKETAIVVCKEYQNKGIGNRCIREMIKLAEELGYDEVKARIYTFNKHSIRMFESIGFIRTEEEIPGLVRNDLMYSYSIEDNRSGIGHRR